MAFIYDLADTWAAAGTVFTAIKLNVTNTASATGSNLMDLQVDSVSKFRVDKNGTLFTGGGEVSTNPAFSMNQGRMYVDFSGYRLIYSVLNTPLFAVNAGYGLVLPSGTPFAFSSTALATGAGDVFLYRDGVANTLAQRNGTNAQAFNIYNTYTDANNYERGFMRWTSNVFEIGTQAGTTGTGRNISISLGGTGSQNVSIATVAFQGFNLLYNGTPFVEFRKYAGGGTTGWVSNSSDMHYRWTSTSSSAIEGDVGIKRDSAGVLKITNGNNAATGAGKLIFIVPTTDPGITGALWNNAGTLSISA